jgi:molybdopterin molybdotransferase
MKRDENENLMPVEEARSRILQEVRALPSEWCGLDDCAGRVLAQDVVSGINIPMLDNSAMDGYAVRAGETTDASSEKPVILRITGEIQAGAVRLAGSVGPGCAIRIMTGAPIPAGADAVIRFEDTSESNDLVSIFVPVIPGDNIRRSGEDVERGMVVLKKGDRIRSADIGMLASVNVVRVQVHRMPVVAVVSTGDEVVEPGEELLPGQVRNSNAYTLVSELRACGCMPCYLGIVRDSRDATEKIFGEAMRCDVMITTGGVSMGRYDFVKEAIAGLGVEISIQNIRMKPGKPCVFGTKGPLLFFGLPGNPVSTMVSFTQFVRPALLALMGASRISKPVVRAVLREDISKKPGRMHFMRGVFTVQEGEFFVSTTGPQGSGILRSMSTANCLILLPEKTSHIPAGGQVFIQLIHHEEI